MTKPLNEREIVLGILMDVTERDVYSHIALRNALGKYQHLDKKERAFITRVVEGTLEHMTELDYILNQFSKVKIRKTRPIIRNILRSALYQLKDMDTVPDSAVCSEAVVLAAKKGFEPLKGFVNGVLRNTARGMGKIENPKEPKEALSVRYSMPKWIVETWLKQYDIETVKKIAADFQKEKPVAIRCNTSLITPEKLVKRLESKGVTVVRHPYLPYAFSITGYDYLRELSCFQEGLFGIQDMGSMLMGEIASPKKGNYIIDVCAAPGGKAIHLGDLLQETGHVEARDLTEYKIKLIQENIDRMRMENISAVMQDATVLDEGAIEKGDIVIADLPCSGLGALGRKTDLKYKMTEQKTEQLAALQREILSRASHYVKPKGTLVYSTCTINQAENMDNVRWFLKAHPNYALDSIQNLVCRELQGFIQWKGCLQLLPGVHDSDGFFIARFIKNRS